MWVWMFAVAATGCGYRAGSFADSTSTFPGTHLALGCIDLAVALSSDPVATGPVIGYAFGNRCRREITLDLASIRAVARDPSGGDRQLTAFDPDHEIKPLSLPPAMTGREAIEYRGVDKVSVICVDVSGADRSAPHTERWVCVGS